MKNYFSFLLAVAAFGKSIFAQQNTFDANLLTGYQQTIKLNPKIKAADVYATAQNWISANGALLTAKNAEPPAEAKPKNKQAVEEAYDNHRPLQSLDPVANKLLGQGLIKYFGGSKTSIRLMYVKYDITIEAKPGQVLFKVSNVRYFHFDPKNYTEANIFSFAGGKPCDNTGTMEYLLDCQSSAEEFKTLAGFFQQTVKGQAKAFTAELQNKKMLPAPATKPVAKPVAKKPANTKPAVLEAGMKH